MTAALKSGKKQSVIFYVSTSGNDRWSGRLAEPNADGTDGPFASLVKARDAVRKFRKQSRQPVQVQVRGGTYFLDQTFVLGHEDSGSPDVPVVYRAFPGEVPVISGGRRITGWTKTTHKGRACWVADLPEVKGGRWNFTQLFVNGQRRLRTRLPRTDYYRFTGFADFNGAKAEWSGGPDRANYAPGQIKNWKNLTDVEIVSYQLWYDTHHHIKRVDENKHAVYFHTHSVGSLRDEKDLYARYFIENVFESLDTPGQWYLDRPAGKLYYLPMDGEDPATAEVIAPALDCLVRFQAGKGDRKVRHVRLENLAFRHSEWTYPLNRSGDAQAAYSVPGAVILDGAEDCVLYGCEVSQIGQYGIEILRGSSGNKIVACSVHDMGAGGIKIQHDELLRKDCTSNVIQKAGKNDKPSNTTVSDCAIYHGGLIFPSAIGIWVGNTGFNRIVHNHIFDMTYTGISCGWTWGYDPNRTVDNRIEYNYIHHLNTDHRLSDNGGVYTLGIQPGTTIRGNKIHDVYCYSYGGWGIYPDEGSSQILIENNLVYRTQEAGYFTHYGRDNLARNNIFALSDKNHVVPAARIEDHRSATLQRNIVYWTRGQLWAGNWSTDHSLFRDNVFWSAGAELVEFLGKSMAFWQTRGQHLNSQVADPLFNNPDAGDFSLRADSPALALGFKPFDSSLAGPRFRGQRPDSFDDFTLVKDEPKEILRTTFEVIKPVGFGEDPKPGKIRITCRNFGTIPAAGSIRLVAGPDGAAVMPNKPIAIRLKPGLEKSVVVTLTPASGAEKVILETQPRGKGLMPGLLLIKKQAQAEVTIDRVKPIPSVDRVHDALAHVPVRRSTFAQDTPLADIAFAIAGNDLAIDATLHDPNVLPNRIPWQGSSLEVFGALPGGKTPAVNQLFLQPAVPGQKAVGLRFLNRQLIPDAGIRIKTEPVHEGYRMQALIPLKFLGLPDGIKKFLLEFKPNIVLPGSRGIVYGVLFNSPTPSANVKGYALVKTR